jgi:hypothetical protein
MRRVYFGQPPVDDRRFRQWLLQSLREIQEASESDTAEVARDFTVSNFTETRSLDAGAATLADLKNVVATLIYDMQRRGSKRSQ